MFRCLTLCFLTTSRHRACAIKGIENPDTIFSSEGKYSFEMDWSLDTWSVMQLFNEPSILRLHTETFSEVTKWLIDHTPRLRVCGCVFAEDLWWEFAREARVASLTVPSMHPLSLSRFAKTTPVWRVTTQCSLPQGQLPFLTLSGRTRCYPVPFVECYPNCNFTFCLFNCMVSVCPIS